MSILIVEKLTKIYKKINVIDNLSLQIKSGEIIGLSGPNSSGKTIICYILIGIVPIDKGKIIIDNNDISALSLYNRRKIGIGYLPKEPSIFRRLSVYDNIMAVLQVREDFNEKQRQYYANNLIKELQIEYLRKHMGCELYGANRRVVEIARTVTANPKFIIMDEPFSNMDENEVNIIKKVISHLANTGIGIIITDVNINKIFNICRRVYLLSQGKIISNA
ncbi:LPS export ABC transporter ATP-binding protein [Candidatus Pantoea edessiphila]|uniref:LPS export ABC transporter ATP-binding protein n=1 Tax=Candidatus Pantoea edessiphila TaxID=2044610 RepID=A0A2P5T1Y6_9GAMM|nr:LPS export ABC transporter ATP-binding protein [Candidatus Pantoea edessiphila]PPI88597.1 LPS export ABC transporter ATP-binding protein [Candidatus Pantoea edessiphila]